MFEKTLCRLCETGEHHTTGFNETPEECTYWLEIWDDGPRIIGIVDGKSFWMPVIRCPWCGKAL